MGRIPIKTLLLSAALLAGLTFIVSASSHREAPGITETPKVDATDFYMFRSYEHGRGDFCTIIANYLPLQDPYGGPNYFTMDPDALYEIHIDNSGDSVEDITFQFRFKNTNRDIALPIGPPGQEILVSVPVINIGPISESNNSALNVIENYQVDVIFGDRRTGNKVSLTNAMNGSRVFTKPVDNIGEKSIPDYETYANSFIYEVTLPDSSLGKLFVGQRKDPFVVNLGETFDLVNLANPIGPPDAENDDLDDKNVTSLCLEIPTAFLTSSSTVVAGWTSASLPTARNGNQSTQLKANPLSEFTQVSRLGNPLVNEVVIGLKDKDKFNGSEPSGDPQFLDYVTNPTLPTIIEILFSGAGVVAPTAYPRNDLVAGFLTGIPSLNADGSVGEMLRLNTATPPRSPLAQSNLGVIGGDVAGFPNGRRPGDDVVDIALRLVMGVLLPPHLAPSGGLPFTDGAYLDALFFNFEFPYLKAPIPGAVN